MKKLTTLTSFLFLFGCATKTTPLNKVASVDTQKFMGTWYVIANIPTFIEKDATHGIERYTWNEKENRIDIMFTQKKGGELKEYPQKAWVHDPSGNEWRVQMWWPLKFPYLIIDLAPDYSYTVVSVPDRDYLWIMSREKTMPEATYNEILGRLRLQKFDLTKIEKQKQD